MKIDKSMIGQHIRFKSDRTRRSFLFNTQTGIVESLTRSEVEISGDYHNRKGFEVVEIIK